MREFIRSIMMGFGGAVAGALGGLVLGTTTMTIAGVVAGEPPRIAFVAALSTSIATMAMVGVYILVMTCIIGLFAIVVGLGAAIMDRR